MPARDQLGVGAAAGSKNRAAASEAFRNNQSWRAAHHTRPLEKALASISPDYDNYGLTANARGAALLGLTPDGGGKNTRQILQGCIDGTIKALWLVGVDLFEEFEDQALVKVALESVEFLVVQDLLRTEAASYASVVLPMNAPAEAEGTWTNIEGRVQRFKQVLPAKGSAKTAWMAAPFRSRARAFTIRLSPRDRACASRRTAARSSIWAAEPDIPDGRRGLRAIRARARRRSGSASGHLKIRQLC